MKAKRVGVFDPSHTARSDITEMPLYSGSCSVSIALMTGYTG